MEREWDPMRRDTVKLFVFAGVVAFAVIYGMELSSKGIKNVNGEFDDGSRIVGQSTQTQSQSGDEDWKLPSRQSADRPTVPSGTAEDDGVEYDWDEQLYDIPRNDRKPIVDRVSGKTAEVLHDLSRNGIRFVVSIFDRVTG